MTLRCSVVELLDSIEYRVCMHTQCMRAHTDDYYSYYMTLCIPALSLSTSLKRWSSSMSTLAI
jgi:hypothetical protein